jgi:hypothetical protein
MPAGTKREDSKTKGRHKRFPFHIPIGDWSGDGHSKCEFFHATAAKPIVDVREAYFKAKKKLPKLCPERFCSEYEDDTLPDGVAAALRDAGCPLPDDLGTFDLADMAAVVVWFLNQGDPELDARPDNNPPEMLSFVGKDEKRRHIGFIGYGLWGQ